MNNKREVFDHKIELQSKDKINLERCITTANRLIERGYGGQIIPLAQEIKTAARRILAQDGQIIYRPLCEFNDNNW